MVSKLDVRKVHEKFKEAGLTNSFNAVNLLLTSLGCHWLNLLNLKHQQENKPVISKYSTALSLRNHLLFIRPSGFGKSMLLRCFSLMLPPEMRVFEDVDLDAQLHIDYDSTGGKVVRYATTVTEAGLVGTFMEGKVKPGLLYETRQGFLLVEEFTAFVNMFKATHSSTLQQILLTALDSGKVNKRLAAGSLDYETQTTLIAGVQPIIDVEAGAGLWRRFTTELFIPTYKDIVKIREKVAESWKDCMSILSNVFDDITAHILPYYYGEVDVYGVHIDDDFLQFVKDLDVSASIIDNYIKMALGYNFIVGNIEDDILIVEKDKYLAAAIISDSLSRKLMMFHLPSLMVLSIIQELLEEGHNENAIPILEVLERSMYYQLSEREVRNTLDILSKSFIVTKETGKIVIRDVSYFNKITFYLEKLRELCVKGEYTL